VVTGMTTTVHPSAVIGPAVQLGQGVTVGAHVSLSGPLVVGDGVVISPGAAIGGPPEIGGVPQEGSATVVDSPGVILEAEVVIRENVVIHQGTHRPTTVGERSWVLNRSYLAHDVQVGRECLISAGTSIGGHCTVASLVTIGMNAVVHQRRHIGRGAMVGMGSVVTHDVPPWAMAYGVPLRVHGVNRVGMSRAGIDEKTMTIVEQAFADGRSDVIGVSDDVALDFAWWAGLVDRRAVPTAGVRP
jgi:UDP-N-acetylglucosamine acyltransferase